MLLFTGPEMAQQYLRMTRTPSSGRRVAPQLAPESVAGVLLGHARDALLVEGIQPPSATSAGAGTPQHPVLKTMFFRQEEFLAACTAHQRTLQQQQQQAAGGQ